MKTIQSTIFNIKEKLDKNIQNYLILKLENKESIFVFPSQISPSKWNDLQVGQTYQFTVKKGKSGNNILIRYKEEFYNSTNQEYLDKNYPYDFSKEVKKEGCEAREPNLCNLNLKKKLNLTELSNYSEAKLTTNSWLEEIKNKSNWTKTIYQNPQEFLNQNYLCKNQVEKIELINLDFEEPSELVIDSYPDLKRIKKNWNQEIPNITKVIVSNCPQLETIDVSHLKDNQEIILHDLPNLRELKCYRNNLTTLDLINLPNLEYINCSFNKLTEIKLPTTVGEKLERLALKSNNFNQDLSFLGGLENLREFDLGDNRFYGSLRPLQNLTKLEKFDINDTDIDSGLEYLPESVKEFDCSVRYRKDTKCQVIYNLLTNDQGVVETKNETIKNFPLKLQILKNNWIKLGFVDEEMKTWTKVGLRLNESELANYLRQNNCQPNTLGIQEIITKETWRDVHEDFNYPLREKWGQKRFSHELVKKWISAGAKVDDYEFVAWLRDTKKETPQWIINYKEDYKALSERFKRYGLCQECNQPNTGSNWCQPCNKSHLFSQQASNSPQINEFIQKYQLEATDADKFIEWVPYEEFRDIKHIADGGFGKVYKAKWTKGNINHWDNENNQWKREKDYYFYKKKKEYKDYKEIVLKSLNNSSQNADLLQEIMKHKIIDDWFNNIVPCYGLSQDPKTGNYLMVMEYMSKGNLRHYLQSNRELGFQDKLKKLFGIAEGLKDIHQKDLIHCDFHSGNILNNISKSFITDLGLCRPTNKEKNEKIYGVLPYVAPELFQDKSYTQASDIYSFGIVAYEILSGFPPYYDIPHTDFLAVWICQGLRPNLNSVQAPQLLKILIQKCWDSDPRSRPTTNDLKEILYNWYLEINNEENSKFTQQLREIKKAKEEKLCRLLSKLYQKYTGQVRKVDSKEIEKVKEELFRKFREKYKGSKKKARETFDKLLVDAPSYQIHPQAIYTSRLLDFENLSKPQNSKEINEIFYKLSDELEDLRISDAVEFSEELKNRFKNLELESNRILIANSEEITPIETQEQQIVTNLTNLHPSFTPQLANQWGNLGFSPELTQNWQTQGFSYHQTQDWISAGFQPTDHHFAAYLRDHKHLTPEAVLNGGNLATLQQEFTYWQQQQFQNQQEQPPRGSL